MSDPTFSDGLMTFALPDGKPILANLSDKHIVLQHPDLNELRLLLEDFRHRQFLWLKGILLAPEPGGRSIHAVGRSSSRGSRGTAETFKVSAVKALRVEKIPAETWGLLPAVASGAKHSAATLASADIESQARFVEAVLGPDIRSAEKSLNKRYAAAFIFSRLEETLSASADGKDFLLRLIRQSEIERDATFVNGKRLGESESDGLRCPVPALLLFWLAQHGIVLNPFLSRPAKNAAMSRGIDEHFTLEPFRQVWRDVKDHLSGVSDAKRNALLDRVFETLGSSTMLRSPEDLEPAMFSELHKRSTDAGDSSIAAVFKQVYEVLRTQSGRDSIPPLHQTPNPSVVQKRLAPDKLNDMAKDFEWVLRRTDDPSATGLFPRGLDEYKPDHRTATVLLAFDFSKVLKKTNKKRVRGLIHKYNRFLRWSAETNRLLAGGLLCLTREEINDGKPVEESDCFRGWLWRDSNGTRDAANECTKAIAAAVDFLALLRPTTTGMAPPRNPFVLPEDLFPTHRSVRGQPSRTYRETIPRELLEIIRERNRRDNFSLSRNDRTHTRKVLDPDTGKQANIWFPGVAILTEMLLSIPLRGMHARFLDSGEGDEEAVIIGCVPPICTPNLLPTATKNRREGCLRVIDDSRFGKGERRFLGIHVNTNKSAITRERSFVIEWCPDHLAECLDTLRTWQAKYNPWNGPPIPCLEKEEAHRVTNDDVLSFSTTTYPLFRDPDDRRGPLSGWPISRGKLSSYWNRLMYATQQELAKTGRHVELTKPNGKGQPVSSYDIHSLRASGITLLMLAGVPPEIVQRISGHDNLTQMLGYFNPGSDIVRSAIEDALARAPSVLSKAAWIVDDPTGESNEDFDAFRPTLFNLSEQGDGLPMLNERRGRGDGGVLVMEHGICPGADCSDGSTGADGRPAGGPLPRARACSLCRHRLTGPSFLAGLTLNCNRLMYEMSRKGKEVARLNGEIRASEDAGDNPRLLRASVEAPNRELEAIVLEWASEIQYVEFAARRFNETPRGESDGSLLPLVSGDLPQIEARLESRPDFVLLQSIAEGAGILPGFVPGAALESHSRFISDVLSASSLDRFMVPLSGGLREKAERQIGRALLAFVPDTGLDLLRTGANRISEFPALSDFVSAVRNQAAAGAIDEENLPPLNNKRAQVSLLTDTTQKAHTP